MAGIYDEQILGARQQAETARKLREGINAPQGQMVSGWYVPPSVTQYLAEGLRTYGAAKKERQAEAEAKRLQDLKRQETQMYMNQMGPQANVSLNPSIMQNLGNPQGMANAFAQGGTQTSYTQPSEQQRMAALIRLSQVNPEAADVPLKMQQLEMQQEERKRAEQAKFGQQEEMLKLAAALRPQQDKLVAVVGPNEQPMYVPQSQAAGMQPYYQAKAAGSQKSNPISDATESNALLNQVEAVGPKATGSGIGNIYDAAAGFFGQSTEGADNAAKLKVLGASLTAKVPKMAGPQSDKDVAMYKEAAGNIADPNVPWPRKKAAIETIREINNRQLSYGNNISGSAFSAPTPTAQAGGAKFLGFE